MVIYTDDADERNVTPLCVFALDTMYTTVVVFHRQRRRRKLVGARERELLRKGKNK